MTLDQKQLVQNTWEKVLPIADSAATLFYGRLFELDPSTRPLFTHTNMPDQRKKKTTNPSDVALRRKLLATD